MITPQQYNDIISHYTEFNDAADAYTTFLREQSLPLSIDTNGLLFAYKTQLFTKLVTVDKGLKMQYDMLKSDAAKQALITATIDLTGYTIGADIANGIAQLNRTLTAANNALFGAAIVKPDLDTLSGYGLSVATYLQAYVIEWSADRAEVLTLVGKYADMMTEMETALNAYGMLSRTIGDLHRTLSNLVSLTNGTATVDEVGVYTMLERAAYHRSKGSSR